MTGISPGIKGEKGTKEIKLDSSYFKGESGKRIEDGVEKFS